ncbi:MAG: hypothetical protein AAB497_01080 [Patescibacteria group bacterium]|mgnify:FL=1
MTLDIIKVFFPTALCFFIGIGITPILTHYFYKYRLWKKKSRRDDSEKKESDKVSHVFKQVHNEVGELSTPRVGGVVIWISVAVTLFIVFLISIIFPSDLTRKLNFLSRNQTILPFFTLIFAALVGLVDDALQIAGKGSYALDSIVYRKVKIVTLVVLGALVGWWFYSKLGMSSLAIPFSDMRLELGLLFIPAFIIVMLATFSGSVIDGIDGLSGGVLATIFSAYAVIAFFQHQIDLAAFSGVVSGGILAFLWFNIPPARFYMGETGMLALTVTLSTLAFLTDTVLVLPIIAFPLVATSASVIIQMSSKRLRGKRVFLVAPLHHHFEALGWPSYKVTMRYWIISVIFAIVGVVIALAG